LIALTTASGVVFSSTCAPINTSHISVLGGYDYYLGRMRQCKLLTFYHSGFQKCSLYVQRHGFVLREGSGLLDSEISFARCLAGFISFPGQVGRLPAQYKIGGQRSKIVKL
jgi:hypothetical protein